ncbi:hypothetical protein BJ742DRAFT_370544 [Cladochytrium replicatum]|nr:hypothetical protein BJ742DRAFT_370544 [Cladochytrium replicatum]
MREGLPGLTRRGEECSIQYWVFWPTFAVYAFACSLGALRCLYSLRKIRDTHDIRLDLSINLVFSTPCFVYFVVATAVLQKTLAPDVFSWVQPGVATYLIIAVNHVTSVLLPIYRDMTESRNTKKLEINMMSFQKVLDDPALFSRLKAFAARDLCSEQVIFLEELRVLEAKVINFDDESTNSKRISLRPSKSKLSNSSMKVYLPSRRDSNESIGAETSADSVDDGVLKSPTSPTLVSAPLEGLSSRDTTKHLEQRLDKSLRSHFKTVCDVFIRSGSPMEVNLSFLVRQACIEAADAGAYVVGMFDAAR